jgi:hypothetical protein
VKKFQDSERLSNIAGGPCIYARVVAHGYSRVDADRLYVHLHFIVDLLS